MNPLDPPTFSITIHPDEKARCLAVLDDRARYLYGYFGVRGMRFTLKVSVFEWHLLNMQVQEMSSGRGLGDVTTHYGFFVGNEQIILPITYKYSLPKTFQPRTLPGFLKFPLTKRTVHETLRFPFD